MPSCVSDRYRNETRLLVFGSFGSWCGDGLLCPIFMPIFRIRDWTGEGNKMLLLRYRAAPSEDGPHGHLLKWSGTWRKRRVEVCTLWHGETPIWQDAFTEKFVLLHDMSSSYNNVNAEEAKFFCGCAGELRFKRRKVRWGYLTAVLADAYQRCTARGRGQHMQAKTGKILVNVRDTILISVLMLDWFFTVVSSATQCLMTVPWLRQPAGSLLAQASNTAHLLEFKPFPPSFPPPKVSMWDLTFQPFSTNVEFGFEDYIIDLFCHKKCAFLSFPFWTTRSYLSLHTYSHRYPWLLNFFIIPY